MTCANRVGDVPRFRYDYGVSLSLRKTVAVDFVLSLCILLVAASEVCAEVTIEQHDDCFRIEVDGELFAEWQTKAWSVPYLYPLIGPNGENITRHFPMRKGVEGEDDDHPHHRSLRFSHRRVNGMSFWSPDSHKEDPKPSIELEKVESMESGDTGELILWNRWMAGGEVLLRERLRLAFHPLADGQMLIDYDTQMHAQDKDVTFQDQKDGGLAIRVAGTMKVVNQKGQAGQGTIINSEGHKDGAAWGKRAKWCDFSGPDAGGKVVGVAIFDHPSNLRFPTHWHARPYGLLTANRFGTGHFEKSKGASPGDGDYTIEAGGSLELRHRLYLHHGDAEVANVEEKYAEYAAEE